MDTSVFIQMFIVLVLLAFLFLMAYDDRYCDDIYHMMSYSMPTYGKKETHSSGVYYREDECRKILEDLTGKEFKKIRPDFLINPESGKPLELDCFNQSMNIALEYNGAQHYKYTPYFHKNNIDFMKQVQRDKLKERLCRENGIHLIVVPYSVKNLRQFITDELNKINTK